MKMDLL